MSGIFNRASLKIGLSMARIIRWAGNSIPVVPRRIETSEWLELLNRLQSGQPRFDEDVTKKRHTPRYTDPVRDYRTIL